MLKQTLDQSISKLIEVNNDDWFATYIVHHKTRFLKDLELITRLIPDRSSMIGDYGAAPFATSMALHDLGYPIDSYDIAPERFDDFIELGLNIQQINLDDWNKEVESKYDFIILTEVFEHLRGDLVKSLSNLKKSLKPNGLLYLTTPNFRSVMGIYKFIFKGISYSSSNDLYHEWNKIHQIGHMGHVREYTVPELSIFFEKLGFEIVMRKTSPVQLGKGLKNQIFFLLEYLTNPLKLGSAASFVLRKP
ncbi:class I SAM-dependent methyltransferase [Marinoscillum sp.]|uniref:class I SAM-dependent methyltransferase n=1 Tax=Marinoscillum sp. TaxID=2024838 RepID=UPI003BAC82CA